MGALMHSDKHLVLNNRHALLGCIAVSSTGKVYRGRDLEQVKHQGLDSRILIHVLPGSPQTWALDEMFQQITSTCQRIRAPWILAPLAYGQDNETAYFVLESPNAWELHSLRNQPKSHQSCYRSLQQRLKPLVKQHYLNEYIDPALLLCAQQEFYLLATAFAPQMQALGRRAEYRPLMPRKHLGQALMTGSLLALFAIFTAVAGNAMMELETVTTTVPTPALPNVIVPSPVPTESILPTAIPYTAVAPVLVSPQDQQVRETQNAVFPVAEIKPKPVAKPEQQTRLTIQKPPIKPHPVESTPQDIPDVSKTPEQPNIEAIIQQAYAAMDAGNLGTGSGALHFARQLRTHSTQHPQVARLGQEITAAYLRQIREALQTNDIASAARLLPITRGLINEFSLSNLTPAQQVLEDKTAELSQ